MDNENIIKINITKANLDLNQNEKNSENTEEKIINIFIEKFKELNKQLITEFSNFKCKEFYLIPRHWFKRLREFIDNKSIQILKELKGTMNNSDYLIDKEMIDHALFLNEEEKNINIIKPKYAFFNKIKPLAVNKDLWDFLHKYLGGGPEIKIIAEKQENEAGKITYKREIIKYIRINCIILPEKRDINDINEYINIIANEIQLFYFYFNKFKKVSELLIHIKKIIEKYQNIKI